MIAKGSTEYKKAQQIANFIVDMATTSREYGELNWGDAEYYLNMLTEDVEKVKGFASEVAKTVHGSVRSWTEKAYAVARCSSKQAWIIACACVENGIDTNY